MTDLTMSQFASKDDLIAAQAARIAELEAEVDAERRHHGIRNASAVRTLHALGYSWRGTDAWQPPAEQGKCLHQIAEPAAPVWKPIENAIDALVMAAFTEGGCSERRMTEARIQTELRKKGLRALLSSAQSGEQVPFMYAIADGYGNAFFEEQGCVLSSEAKDLQPEVDGLNENLDGEPPYKVVAVYTHPAQLSAVQTTKVVEALEMLENGALNVAENAKNRGDDYGVGYAQAMAKMARDTLDVLSATAHPAEGVPAQVMQEELAQLGYQFKDGRMLPPDHVGELLAVVKAAPDWSNRSTNSLDGWINELGTLAANRKIEGIRLRAAIMTIFRGLQAHATHTAPAMEAIHPDDAAVDALAALMKTKLAKQRAKGYGGWQTCTPQHLSELLRDHVDKGDPVDVANFCAFLVARSEEITAQDAPLPLLMRDIARDLGINAAQACAALKPWGDYSTNSAVTSEMAKKLREVFPVPARTEIDDLIDRLLDAQQDLNLAANVHMDQSIASASTLLDEVEIALRAIAATHPAPALEVERCEALDALSALHDSIELCLKRGHLSEQALEAIVMQPATDVLMRYAIESQPNGGEA